MDDDVRAEFEGFVAVSSTRLLQTAFLLTGDRGEAEDLLQTALAKTFRHWTRIRDRDDPTAFVRRVLVTTISGWRRRRRVSEVLGGIELFDGPAAAEADFAERDLVMQALGQLPPRMRAVLVLRYWEDLSEAGTAEVMGCGVTTVRTHARRGLARLRLVLADEAPQALKAAGPADDDDYSSSAGFPAQHHEGGH